MRFHHAADFDRVGLRPRSGETTMPEDSESLSRYPTTAELVALAHHAVGIARATGLRVAVIGGLAMQLYGSPRFTRDLDLVSDGIPREPGDLRPLRRLSFGGTAFASPSGIEIDWIAREDAYRALYEESLEQARARRDGLPVVQVEHLATMKFATLRPKDYEDLMFLLGKPGLVDIEQARTIVFRTLGGQFALDQFTAATEEARWRASLE